MEYCTACGAEQLGSAVTAVSLLTQAVGLLQRAVKCPNLASNSALLPIIAVAVSGVRKTIEVLQPPV